MTEATVLKPATMAAENIKSGVNIGGVVGSLVGKLPEEEKTVTITENGTTEVNSTDGKVMTKVVVTTNVIGNNKLPQVIDQSITELTVDDLAGCTKLSNYAFYLCQELVSIELPDTITEITGQYTFNNCVNLERIIIPDSVQDVTRRAFAYSPKVYTYYDESKHFGYIDKWLAYVYNNEKEVDIREDTIGIAGYTFGDSISGSLTQLVVPSGVKYIGSYAFYNCISLTSVELPDSIEFIGRSAFSNCKKLQTLRIPSKITKIPNDCFNACASLVSIDFNNVKQLGDSVFSDAGLTEIELPLSITEMGTYCFSYCKKLQHLELGGVTILRQGVFSGCTSLTKFIVPESLKQIIDYAFNNSSIDSVYISNLEAWCNLEIHDLSLSKNTTKFYLNDTLITDLVIPDGVTVIKEYVFRGFSINSVKLPDGLIEIQYCAFQNCVNLIEITIPKSVTTIGNYAFYIDVSNIAIKQTVTMLSATPPTIGSNTFNTSNLDKIIVPKGSGDTYKKATNWSAFANYIEEATV